MAFNSSQAYFAFQRGDEMYRVLGSQADTLLQNSDRVIVGQGTSAVSVTVAKVKASHSALDLDADMVPYTDTADGETYKVSLRSFKNLL